MTELSYSHTVVSRNEYSIDPSNFSLKYKDEVLYSKNKRILEVKRMYGQYRIVHDVHYDTDLKKKKSINTMYDTAVDQSHSCLSKKMTFCSKNSSLLGTGTEMKIYNVNKFERTVLANS